MPSNNNVCLIMDEAVVGIDELFTFFLSYLNDLNGRGSANIM